MITKKYKIRVKNLDLEDPVSTNVKLKTNNINKQIKIDIIGGRIYSVLTLDDWYNNVPTSVGDTRNFTLTLPNTNFYILVYLTPNPNTGVYPKMYWSITNTFINRWGSIGYEYNTDGTSGGSYKNVTRPGGKPGCIGMGWAFFRYSGGTKITGSIAPLYSGGYPFGGYYNRPDSSTIKQFGIVVVPMNTPTWDFLNNYWTSSWNYNWHNDSKWFSKNLNNTAVPLMEYIIKYIRVRKTNSDTYWK